MRHVSSIVVDTHILCDTIPVGLLDVVSVMRGAGIPLFIACVEECFGSDFLLMHICM